MRTPFASLRGPRTALRATALALPLLLVACAEVPEWKHQATLQPAVPAQLTATQSATQTAWPQEQWWLRYGDTQLNALIAEALHNAPDMAVAAARVRQAQAMLDVNASATGVQLNANANVAAEKYSYHYLTPSSMVPHGMNDTGRATLDLRWSLDLWGKHRAAIAAAAGELQAREADAAQAQLVLTAGIASAYAELVRLHSNMATLQQSLQLRSQTVQLFQERSAHGLENQGSVHSAQARLAGVQVELLQVQEMIGLQRHRIAALVGASPERAQQITMPAVARQSLWQQQWGVPGNLPANLLGRRADVVAARLQAQALASRATAKEAEFYPDVNLSAFVGVQALGLDMLAKSGSAVAGIGPAISLPILNGGRLRAQLGAARAQYDEAVANYQATLLRALQEVADNATSQHALQQQLVAMQSAVEAASAAHRVARNRYEGGLANYLEVLSAEDQLLTSVRQLVDVQSRALTLDIALHRALGGGWQAAPQP